MYMYMYTKDGVQTHVYTNIALVHSCPRNISKLLGKKIDVWREKVLNAILWKENN